MSINRAPFNALVDDNGSNIVGSAWNKAAIKDVILDPVDAALAPAWVLVPYSAANFTGGSGMTWTVEAGDQLRYAYLVAGKTLTLSVWIGSSSVGGTLSNELRIALPAGKVAAAIAAGTAWIVNGPTPAIGSVIILAGNTYVSLLHADQSANYSASTNATSIAFTFTFEIQ